MSDPFRRSGPTLVSSHNDDCIAPGVVGDAAAFVPQRRRCPGGQRRRTATGITTARSSSSEAARSTSASSTHSLNPAGSHNVWVAKPVSRSISHHCGPERRHRCGCGRVHPVRRHVVSEFSLAMVGELGDDAEHFVAHEHRKRPFVGGERCERWGFHRGVVIVGVAELLPLVEQARIDPTNHLAEPLGEIVELLGLDVDRYGLHHRFVTVGEVAQHGTLAALQP